jgi:5'-nucleotidase
MFEPIKNLSSARILISNDDGIDAPGIQVLERIARTLSDDVWVIAPATEQSAVAHSLTIRRPLRIVQQDERHFAVDGTPTDSVFLAVRHVLQDKRPDLVLSGVNRGCNIAEDVTYSGTVAAAMEGTLLNVPSIALSQIYTSDNPVKWATAERCAPEIIRRLTAAGWPRNVLMNVNFPDVDSDQITGVELVRQGNRKVGDPLTERIDPRGQTYFWIGGERVEDCGQPGTDLDAISRGAVSVTPLGVDFTDQAAISYLQTKLQ